METVKFEMFRLKKKSIIDDFGLILSSFYRTFCANLTNLQIFNKNRWNGLLHVKISELAGKSWVILVNKLKIYSIFSKCRKLRLVDIDIELFWFKFELDVVADSACDWVFTGGVPIGATC